MDYSGIFICGDRAVKRRAFTSVGWWMGSASSQFLQKRRFLGPTMQLSQTFVMTEHLYRFVRQRLPSQLLRDINKFFFCACRHEATDPRDKIYVLHAIAPQSLRHFLEPDYTVDVEVAYTTLQRRSTRVSGLSVCSTAQGLDTRKTLTGCLRGWPTGARRYALFPVPSRYPRGASLKSISMADA